MKNLVRSALLLLVVFSSSVVFGQQMQKRTPEQKAENQTRWMQKNLGLTQDQNKKVYDIILYYAQQADNANASAGQAKKAEKLEVKRDKDTELRAVLTGEQYQKYQAHVQEMKEKMRDRRAGMQDGY